MKKILKKDSNRPERWPHLVVSGLFLPLHCAFHRIDRKYCKENFNYYRKHENIKEKTHLGPNNASGIVWATSRHLWLPSPSPLGFL